jgi:mRNA interferase RelE/StbE
MSNQTYRIEIEPAAWRQLMKLGDETQEAVTNAIEALELNPRPAGSKKLKDEKGRYRIRIGDFRVVYEIHDGVLVILIVRVGNRREVYRMR